MGFSIFKGDLGAGPDWLWLGLLDDVMTDMKFFLFSLRYDYSLPYSVEVIALHSLIYVFDQLCY